MDELVDLLAKLVGTLREDDLQDPEIAGLMSQLFQILDPEPEAFPAELGEELMQIPDKIERFKTAAERLGPLDPQKLKMLAESMKQAGLFKAEASLDLKRAEKADLVTLPDSVQGTNCFNCKFVDQAKSVCNHPEVLQPVSNRMCCSYWDAHGTKRAWEKK